MIGIYLIRNKISGKCYVGQSMDVEARWKRHIRDSKKKSRQAIHNAISKYGEEQFEFSVLEECSAEELDAREIHWIKELDTYNNGYNCTIGGGGSNQGKDCYSAEYISAYSKAYYEENKEKQRSRSKAWRDANRDKYRAYKKDYNEANKEKIRAYKKAYNEANKDDPEFKEKECARMKAWRDANREKVKATKKAFYEKVKDDPEFKEKHREASKAYREAHKEQIKAYNKAYRESLKEKPTKDFTDMPLF